MQSSIQFHMFGQFCARNSDRIWYGHECGKVQELLCYLLVHRRARHQREHLAALFWAESGTAQSKKYLRQCLWQLQAAFKKQLAVEHGQFLLTNGDWIQINPELDLWTDVSSFEQFYVHLQSERTFSPQSLEKLQLAEKLYQGELLEGWQQEWCLYERERLQNMYLAILGKLIVHSEARGEPEAGLGYGARILEIDPAHERTHQQMMRLHYLAGDRTEALRQFDYCADILRRELGVKPTRRTFEIYEQICADQLESRESIPSVPVDEPPPSLPIIYKHIRQLQTGLATLQQQLQHYTQLLERHLPSTPDRTE